MRDSSLKSSKKVGISDPDILRPFGPKILKLLLNSGKTISPFFPFRKSLFTETLPNSVTKPFQNLVSQCLPILTQPYLTLLMRNFRFARFVRTARAVKSCEMHVRLVSLFLILNPSNSFRKQPKVEKS